MLMNNHANDRDRRQTSAGDRQVCPSVEQRPRHGVCSRRLPAIDRVSLDRLLAVLLIFSLPAILRYHAATHTSTES